MPTFLLHSFGCKANQYESEALRRRLRDAGWDEIPVRGNARADLVVINSCAVTARAEQDARRRSSALGERAAATGGRVVLTGCAASLGRDWNNQLPAAVAILPNAAKSRLLEHLAATGFPDAAVPADALVDADADGGDPRFALAVRRFAGHARAFLKIQDGCDTRCAYCAVAAARGAAASRPADAVVAEARRLVAGADGHREINLTGIHIGAYRDADGTTLAGLLRRLAREVNGTRGRDGDAPIRWRLGSVEPTAVTDELLEAMAGTPGVMPHLHIPLQSGDDGVLARMNRPHDAADYLAAVARARRHLDRPGIGVDVMAGFPGEDEAAFARTLAVCGTASASRGHVFPFSPRPGTPAASMPGRPAAAEVAERARRLAEIFARTAADFARSWLGTEALVVVEAPARKLSPGGAAGVDGANGAFGPPPAGMVWRSGYTERYVRAHFAAPPSLRRGAVARVRLAAVSADELRGAAT